MGQGGIPPIRLGRGAPPALGGAPGLGGRGGAPGLGGRGGGPGLGATGGRPGMPPALGAGPPGAADTPQIDGFKMAKDLKVPQLLYMVLSQQKSLVEKIFDVKREFSYNGQDPRMISDLMILTQTNAGVPDF